MRAFRNGSEGDQSEEDGVGRRRKRRDVEGWEEEGS